jgi:glycosyltransferase involved in cell wall biosynthesis
MRVCHVTSLHPPFDVRIYHKECRTLAQAGHEVTLLAQADWKEKDADGIHVIGLPKITKRHQRPVIWRRIVTELRRLRPDIVHFHNPELLLITPFLRPAKLIYDCQEDNAQTMLVRRWIPRPLRHPVSRLMAFLEPLLASRVDAIVVTEDSHIRLFEKCGCPVILLYNYPLAGNLDFTRQGNGKTVLHVGILSEGRGAWTMIEAMRRVAQNVPEARLLLVGSFDDPEAEAEIHQMIRDYGLEKRVVLAGWVPFSDLAQWFVQGDVGLVPWQTEELFPPQIIPTKMFEYMSFGMPVVVSNRPTISRFMDGLECGLLVEPGDSKGFAEAIEYLLNHPGEASRMGERGKQAVKQAYCWDTEGEKLLALYRQLE